MFNNGDKFIIEIEDIVGNDSYITPKESTICLYKVKGFNALVLDETGLKKLKRYDDRPAQKAYLKGLNDAWEAVRSIYKYDESDNGALFRKFHAITYPAIFQDNTATQAIEIIKAYEKENKAEDQKVRVGDEVCFKDAESFKIVVTKINYNGQEAEISGICTEPGNVGREVGDAISEVGLRHWKKTGKHYKKIEKLF